MSDVIKALEQRVQALEEAEASRKRRKIAKKKVPFEKHACIVCDKVVLYYEDHVTDIRDNVITADICHWCRSADGQANIVCDEHCTWLIATVSPSITFATCTF